MPDSLLQLCLLRHADALPAPRGGQDFDRKLSEKGQAEAEAAGRRLAALPFNPQRIVTSPAERAVETAIRAARELGHGTTGIVQEPRLYLAEAGTIASIVTETGAGVNRLLLVGHNPGLSDLIEKLSGGREAAGLRTGEFKRFEFSASSWSDALEMAAKSRTSHHANK